jgi:hypothetical protein
MALVDTSNRDAICAFASQWKGSLHLPMNVASTAAREITATGIELQFATQK